jgi:hypothetical protein
MAIGGSGAASGGQEIQAQLETAHQQGLAEVLCTVGRWQYVVKLREMTQTNVTTQTERRVRRFPEPQTLTATSTATTMECSVCCEDKPTADFNDQFASSCTHHVRDICNECCQRHIHEEVRGKGNATEIKCPTCSAVLEHVDVKRFATVADFQHYDEVLNKQTLQTMPEFRWCSRAGCGSGQLVEGADANPIMICVHCRAKTCFTHRTAHPGKSCAEYDREKAASEEAALEHLLQTTTKPCPGCNAAIEKNDGCDHMTCAKTAGGCGFEFCWRCGADYNGASGIRAIGNGAHKTTCTWHM